MASEPTRDPVADHLLTPKNSAFVIIDEPIDRTSINSWEDVEFKQAVKATGRKKLIMAALWTEACLTFLRWTRCARATRSIRW
jgi:hypothetical protein